MNVDLAYGRHGLRVNLPDDAVVIRPVEAPGLADEAAALAAALARPIDRPPLRHLVRPGDAVVIVFGDITRPMPSDRVLPVLLRALDGIAPRERITLLNGLGAHRPNTPEELEEILGADIVRNHRIIQSCG